MGFVTWDGAVVAATAGKRSIRRRQTMRGRRKHNAGELNRLARSFTFIILMVAPLLGGRASAQGQSPVLEIVSPQPGETILTDTIEVRLRVSNFDLSCRRAGRPDAPGVGHIHVMLDGMTMGTLTNFYCRRTLTIPGAGLTAGPHTLIVDLATNTHMDMMETAQQVEFVYEPANPRPLPEPVDLGLPAPLLISPEDGATVPPKFTVQLSSVNFVPSENLEGKGNVPGYGHWHVFVDTTDPMALMEEAMARMEKEGSETAGQHMAMPMPAMVLMPGTNRFELDLTAWGPGKHTIFIEPVQNDHTNFETFDHLVFTVTVDPNLAPTS